MAPVWTVPDGHMPGKALGKVSMKHSLESSRPM